MALDERDRNFEKALARHLRPAAGSEDSATLQASGGAEDVACADAEILAAYHERRLSQEELISWKAHIAGCARCQELLAQLELTDGIPVNAETAEAQHAASLLGATAGGVASPAPSANVRAISAKRVSRLRWVAPAGAIAAGLLVWVVVRDNKTLPTPETSRVEIAAKMEPSAPEARPKAAPIPREDAALDKETERMSVPASAAKEKDSFTKALPFANSPLQGRNKQKMQPAEQKGAAIGGTLSTNQNQSALDSATGARAIPRRDANQAAGVQQNTEVQSSNTQNIAQTPPPAPPSSTQSQLPPSASTPAQSADAVSQSAQNQIVVAPETRAYSDALGLKKIRAGTARDARLAAAPGGNVVWHVGLGGLIEKSTDRGKTFTRLESGVKSELVSASAPDDSVCWVVGRSGTILLTVDGGAHWNKVASPFPANIGGVHAEDALHATIWDTANPTVFATTDGGTTWTRAGDE